MGVGRASTIAVVPAWLLWIAGCGATRAYTPDPGPYDRIPAEWEEGLARARQELENGALQPAHDTLRGFAAERPEVLPVRIFHQELQLAILEAGARAGGEREPYSGSVSTLANAYRQRAAGMARVEEYVLTARFAPNLEEALELLDKAAAIDRDCVWVHYARAWWYARSRRFAAARSEVAEAFQLDGGHMPTMRLHASLQAGAGETDEAIACLQAWLERSEPDPTIDPRQRAEAVVDLAALHALRGESGRALDTLDRLDPDDLADRSRADLVEAVALSNLGDLPRALSAARRARAHAPDSLLPLAHQAMLLELQGNSTQEMQAWERLLEEAERIRESREAGAPDATPFAEESVFDFGGLLIELQANARLGRIAEERAARRRAAP